MMWLIVYNWFQLVVAFAFGFVAAWWVLFRPGAHGREDLFAEIASERTRRQEVDAERAKLRAKVAELQRQLGDARRLPVEAPPEASPEASAAGQPEPRPTTQAPPSPAAGATPAATERPVDEAADAAEESVDTPRLGAEGEPKPPATSH